MADQRVALRRIRGMIALVAGCSAFVLFPLSESAAAARTAPVITTEPINTTVPPGGTATFSAAASGQPLPTVQWQVRLPGGSTFGGIAGATTMTLTLTSVTSAMSGNRYRAVFRNRAGSAYTSAALLTVAVPTSPAITKEPSNVAVPDGSTVTFNAAASGVPAPTVQWQQRPAGALGFSPVPGATSPSLTLLGVTTSMSGTSYEAVFTNSVASATTNTATLTVEVLDHIALSPSTVTVAPNVSQSFTAEGYGASGDDLGSVASSTTLSISPDGTCSATSCSATATGSHTVTGTDGSVSSTATLTVSPPDHLVLSPANATVGPSGTVAFSAEAYDAANNQLGDVTASSTFAISPAGTCNGSICGGTAQTGTYTVSAADGMATGTATLTVSNQKFVELIFSRTEVTATDGGCNADDTNIARLDTTVAPYLQSLGLTATGSIETGPTLPAAFWCAHYGLTMATSWNVAKQLAADGWTFVSHSKDYPASTWSSLTLAQKWDETCGSAQVIDANGLPGGDDMFLWPDNKFDSQALTSFVEPCFGTNRVDGGGITSAGQLTTPPYQQSVRGLAGGSCNVSGSSCATVPGAAFRYRTPSQIISAIQTLQPGQVLSLQVYLTVTGASPAYTTNTDRWDCTSPDPNYHWTNDTERYCWTDLQTVLQYLVNSGLTITQPGVVNAAFGRTGYSDQAIPRPS